MKDISFKSDKLGQPQEARVGWHRQVDCPWCKKVMGINHINCHIGGKHAEKANEKQLEAARKSRIYKFVICDRCGGSK